MVDEDFLSGEEEYHVDSSTAMKGNWDKSTFDFILLFIALLLSLSFNIASNAESNQSLRYVKHPAITNSNFYLRLFPTVDYLTYGEMTDATRYARNIDQFNVTYGEHDRKVDGWYESNPDSSFRKYTYCNYFAVDVSYAMGAYLPLVHCCVICGRPTQQSFQSIGVSSTDHYLYFPIQDDSLICMVPEHSSSHRDFNANMIADWLNNSEFSSPFGWNPIKETEAQAYANKGLLTIGIRKESGAIGHVFVVHPHPYPGSSIYISQAGFDLMSDEKKPTNYVNYQYYVNKARTFLPVEQPSYSHDKRLEGSWQLDLFGFTAMTFTFRRDGTMTISTLGSSLEGTYSTSGDRYTMDYVIPGYGSYSSIMESAFQGSGMDPGIAGSGTFILSGNTLYLDGLQFTRIR